MSLASAFKKTILPLWRAEKTEQRYVLKGLQGVWTKYMLLNNAFSNTSACPCVGQYFFLVKLYFPCGHKGSKQLWAFYS